MATGIITYKLPIIGISEPRRGDVFISDNQLIQANTGGNIMRLQKIKNDRLAYIAEISATSGYKNVKIIEFEIIR
jgi:hypothetical protein